MMQLALQRCYLLKWLRWVDRTVIYCSCLIALQQMRCLHVCLLCGSCLLGKS